MPAKGEVGVDAIFECRQPLLLESRDLCSSERLLGKVLECGASPELQRTPEECCRSVGRLVLRVFDQAFEAAEVNLFRRGSEEVARRARDDRVFAQRLPQPGHIYLERLRRGGGRALAPEPVDERIGRDDVPHAKDEHCENAPLLVAAEVEQTVARFDLQCSEDPEVQSLSSRLTGVFTADHRGLQPPYATFLAMPERVGPKPKEARMKRLVITGAALFAAVSVAASLGAATTKPYVGEWKARMTKAQLIDQGFVDPRAVGVWRLVLERDGTYRAFNPLDKWTNGDYTATDRRVTFRHDPFCLGAGFKGGGRYRWSIKNGNLKLTTVSVGSDPCGGRFQTLSYPLWQRA
jgi:hypothetical protein